MNVDASMDLRFEETIPEFMEHVTDLSLNHVELKREYLHAPSEPPDSEHIGELADSYGVSITYHTPFRDRNLGSFNNASRNASVEQVRDTLVDAATADAGDVVVHSGSGPQRYPNEFGKKPARTQRARFESVLRTLPMSAYRCILKISRPPTRRFGTRRRRRTWQ